MGQSLDIYYSGIDRYRNPDIVPDPSKEPSFDPNLGFNKPRKERVMHVTEEEMMSAKIPLEFRDYCAHKLIDYHVCRKKNWPWVVNCHHEKHAYLTCEYEDYVMRMKEYERERRLRVKAKNGELEV
ncbi:NADH dehydrogenase [ubiquinone] 1 beta subcomplex subunit 7 [Coccinella septempunctata]|uniref:NADH dehydrogenase [ubiquinone] 1 beta subcomplex subunit 7 n=1 Tax=Coccinella septempunctata TaxID=41139 RepID=UPI001D08430A|nr:NADH dehydrogenase [ubiquinone] 1 beta subcomplex subunit 7 [Coccinella septempunctata]